MMPVYGSIKMNADGFRNDTEVFEEQRGKLSFVC